MNRVKELRTKCKLSLRKVQEYTGIDFSRLAVIEKTNANMEMKTIEKLCKFFKVSQSYLLGNDGDIYYFDEVNKKYFYLPHGQYRNALNDDVITYSIQDGSVKRVISNKGYERIESLTRTNTNALQNRIIVENLGDFLKSLNEFEYKKSKERILQILDMEDIKRGIK